MGQPHFIVFANEKGGTGKSTTAVHTAIALAASGHRVGALDLDQRQRYNAAQLAWMQQRTAAQQSAETFGPMATGAVGALALGFKSGDLFAPTLTHGLPLIQLMLASRGRAMTAGFNASPWTTLAFPAAALGSREGVRALLEATAQAVVEGTLAPAQANSVSNLAGVALRFPEPFAKPPGQPTSLELGMTFPVNGLAMEGYLGATRRFVLTPRRARLGPRHALDVRHGKGALRLWASLENGEFAFETRRADVGQIVGQHLQPLTLHVSTRRR